MVNNNSAVCSFVKLWVKSLWYCHDSSKLLFDNIAVLDVVTQKIDIQVRVFFPLALL